MGGTRLTRWKKAFSKNGVKRTKGKSEKKVIFNGERNNQARGYKGGGGRGSHEKLFGSDREEIGESI